MQPASENPTTRQRVVQACINCSRRKTRCDGARPRCAWCSGHNVECTYPDLQHTRVDHGTKILLDRMQQLEDRIVTLVSAGGDTPGVASHHSVDLVDPQPPRQGEPHVLFPHTGNSDHVFSWPIVQEMLSNAETAGMPVLQHQGATDVYFQSGSSAYPDNPPETWRLFPADLQPASPAAVSAYREIIDVYFNEVDVFYPILSKDDILTTLHQVVSSESGYNKAQAVPATRYGLLLLVLAFGSFAASGRSYVSLTEPESIRPHTGDSQAPGQLDEDTLWSKGKLLLGYMSPDEALESALCLMVAGLYLGAKGQVAASFHYTHAAAVKCEAIASMAAIAKTQSHEIPDSFRRLYWVSFIYEGDFVSEISITTPSGITRHEDFIPYPFLQSSEQQRFYEASAPGPETDPPPIIAYQISTNAFLRRALNQAISVVYDKREQHRMQRSDHASWLLRVTDELWSHYSALYQNIPEFLLTNRYNLPTNSESSPGPGQPSNLENNPWNVTRLKGRYYAGLYFIHRPCVDFVIANLSSIDGNPSIAAILDRCRLCLDGCRGFIRVFDVDPANSITCLFIAGMVHFTMAIILRVVTISPIFKSIMPDDIEEAITIAKRNLLRFSRSIQEFAWHLEVVKRLDAAAVAIR